MKVMGKHVDPNYAKWYFRDGCCMLAGKKLALQNKLESQKIGHFHLDQIASRETLFKKMEF